MRNPAIMNGPEGKPMHAELRLLGTTSMLEPENPGWRERGARTVGASPAGLYLYVEGVDKVVVKAVKLGAATQGLVTDMFWGDRCGTVVDPVRGELVVRQHFQVHVPTFGKHDYEIPQGI